MEWLSFILGPAVVIGLMLIAFKQKNKPHPTLESLAGLLMLALYRSGRQADALEVYTRTRDVLDEVTLAPAARSTPCTPHWISPMSSGAGTRST